MRHVQRQQTLGLPREQPERGIELTMVHAHPSLCGLLFVCVVWEGGVRGFFCLFYFLLFRFVLFFLFCIVAPVWFFCFSMFGVWYMLVVLREVFVLLWFLLLGVFCFLCSPKWLRCHIWQGSNSKYKPLSRRVTKCRCLLTRHFTSKSLNKGEKESKKREGNRRFPANHE